MAAIFIGHSSRDNAVAGEIKAWLRKEGYERTFLDFDKETGLDAGKEWERQLSAFSAAQFATENILRGMGGGGLETRIQRSPSFA